MWVGRRVSVTDVATLIIPANPRRQSFLIRNSDGANSISLGGLTVTFAAGFELLAGQSAECTQLSQMTREAKAPLYGIANTGLTVIVHVLEYFEPALDGSVPS
jgi:hypothetical protein